MQPITPEQLLQAYRHGYFPMAMAQDDPELYWFSPEERGVLPLDRFNLPRGLKRSMKTRHYTVTTDQAFEDVIRGCGKITKDRDGTWINDEIIKLYTALHKMGHAHSVEVWQDFSSPLEGERQSANAVPRDAWGVAGPRAIATPHDSQELVRSPSRGELKNYSLLGGLYGVSIGGAFFGESMFSRAPDASKIALVALVDILNEAGYALLDTQYVNDHLLQFGVEAIPKAAYMTKLENALSASPNPSSRFSTASVRRGFASASSVSST